MKQNLNSVKIWAFVTEMDVKLYSTYLPVKITILTKSEIKFPSIHLYCFSYFNIVKGYCIIVIIVSNDYDTIIIVKHYHLCTYEWGDNENSIILLLPVY